MWEYEIGKAETISKVVTDKGEKCKIVRKKYEKGKKETRWSGSEKNKRVGGQARQESRKSIH